RGGTYTPCTVVPPPQNVVVCDDYRKNSMTWLEKGFRWQGGSLVEKWTFTSDWKPVPSQSFEPMFQPAVSGDAIYVPGGGGSIYQLDRATGAQVRQIKALGDALDLDTYVTSGLAVDGDGAVWYTAMKLDHGAPYVADAQGWLVKVPAGGAAQTKALGDLVTGAPAADAACVRTFNRANNPLPWPPPDDAAGNPAVPPSGPCGSQRPAINAVPAISPDGTVFIVTKAHFNDRYAYVTAVRPDLTTKWAASMRGYLADGCGVLIPADDNPANCRAGARTGVDPATNDKPAGRVVDSSSSSPVALPDGGVVYGSYTSYNGFRGHLIRFTLAGQPAAAYDFGWDTTPALYRQGDRYSVILKENNYGQDSAGTDLGPFFITQLGEDLRPRWQYRHTDTESCERDDTGQ